jgi:hypothetical protein
MLLVARIPYAPPALVTTVSTSFPLSTITKSAVTGGLPSVKLMVKDFRCNRNLRCMSQLQGVSEVGDRIPSNGDTVDLSEVTRAVRGRHSDPDLLAN